MSKQSTPIDPQFGALDSLRLVGALGVVLTHTAFWAGAYTTQGTVGTILARLDSGVAIFFVLSGFLLSRPWLARARQGLPMPSVGRYFWKRVLRIYPVYVITAVIALSLLHDNRGKDLTDWLTTLTLTDIYVHSRLPAGLTQMWSLATELAFYVALPFLMLLALGRTDRLDGKRVMAVVVGMVALTPLWLGGLGHAWPGADLRATNEWLPGYTAWFGAGIALALLQVKYANGDLSHRSRRLVETIGGSPGALWAVVAGLLLVATTPVAGPTMLVAATESEAVTKNLLYAAIGTLLVFTGVFSAHNPTYDRLMNQRWLRHLGHTSYSLFCIHLPLLHFVMWFTGWDLFGGRFVAITGLTIVLSLIAAELLYRFVELPFMRLKNLGRRPAAMTTAAPRATRTK